MTELIEMLAPFKSPCRPGYTLTPKGVTIHNTANTKKGAGARSHGAYLQGAGRHSQVSYHYAVDDDVIVRIIPDNEVAWHAGDGGNGPGNRTTIAIEICENPESDLRSATDNAAELTARLLKDYGLTPQNVYQHNHWSGKNCPNRIRRGEPYSWDVFISKVEGHYKALKVPKPSTATPQQPSADADTLYTVQTGAFKSKENAEKYAADLKKKGVATYIKEKED